MEQEASIDFELGEHIRIFSGYQPESILPDLKFVGTTKGDNISDSAKLYLSNTSTFTSTLYCYCPEEYSFLVKKCRILIDNIDNYITVKIVGDVDTMLQLKLII